MDTGATSHMTANAGILSSYFISSNKNHNIIIGDSHLISIVGQYSTTLHSPHHPFIFQNVLHTPRLIKI